MILCLDFPEDCLNRMKKEIRPLFTKEFYVHRAMREPTKRGFKYLCDAATICDEANGRPVAPHVRAELFWYIGHYTFQCRFDNLGAMKLLMRSDTAQRNRKSSGLAAQIS